MCKITIPVQNICMVSVVHKKVWKIVKVNFINPNISCDVTLGISDFQKSNTTITSYFYKVPGQNEWWPVLKLTRCLLSTGCHCRKAQFTTVKCDVVFILPCWWY